MRYICASAHEKDPNSAAEDLLNKLHLRREECMERPIIFVGYALGGPVIERALVTASRTHLALLSSFAGIVFVDTPLVTTVDSGGRSGDKVRVLIP